MSDPTQEVAPIQPPSDPTLRAAMHKNNLWWLVECYCPFTDNGYARIYFHLDLDGEKFAYPTESESYRTIKAYGDRGGEERLFWLPGVIKEPEPWALRIFLTNGIDFQRELPLATDINVESISNMAHQMGSDDYPHMEFGGIRNVITLVCWEDRKTAPSQTNRFCVTAMRLHMPFFTPEVKAIINQLTEPLLVFDKVCNNLHESLKRQRNDADLVIQMHEEIVREAKRRRLEADVSLKESYAIIAARDTDDFFKAFRTKAPRPPETDERLRLVNELESEFDHDILSGAAVTRFEEVFRCTILTQKYSADLLFDPNGAGGNEGLAAEALAERLCTAYGVDYAKKIGRGTQLRECCAKLRAYFNSL